VNLAAASLGLLLLFGADGTQKAAMTNFRVGLEAANLDVSFDLAHVFDEELVERIQTGLPTGFEFTFKLVKGQKWWFDNTLLSAHFQVVAMYNAVTHEYLVNFKQNGKLVESRVVREVAELREAMTHLEKLHVFDLTGLKTKKRLTVRGRAELGSKNLFFLIPTRLKTDWIESRRFRLPETLE
jgi:hypothetical protein